MMDFTNKTYAAILADMLAQVDNKFDKREGGMIQTALGPAAYALEAFYLALDQVQKAGFVQTAMGEDLDKLAVLAGLTRYPASPAVRLGVFNLDVPIGARFSTVNGAQSIDFTVTQRSSAGRFQLTADTPGEIGNSYAGPILPITFIQGLTSAQITDILVPGDDQEEDDSLRQRIISALNERPFGGNIAAYRTEILSIDGVGAVQIYPVWNGGGTVKCSVLGADLLPAGAVLVTAIQNRIDPPPNQLQTGGSESREQGRSEGNRRRGAQRVAGSLPDAHHPGPAGKTGLKTGTKRPPRGISCGGRYLWTICAQLDFSKQLIRDIRGLLWVATLGGLGLAAYCMRNRNGADRGRERDKKSGGFSAYALNDHDTVLVNDDLWLCCLSLTKKMQTRSHCGVTGFIIPSSSNLIGMLYGDEYSNGTAIFKYGCALGLVSVLIVVLFGYLFSRLFVYGI